MNTRRVYRQTATRRNSIELLLFIPLLILILFFLYELPKRHAWCSKLLWKKRKSDLASAEHKKCFEICVHTKQKISSFFTKFFSSTFFFLLPTSLSYMIARRRIRPFSKFDREKTRRGNRPLMMRYPKKIYVTARKILQTP